MYTNIIYKHIKNDKLNEHKFFGITVFKIEKTDMYRKKYICGLPISKRKIYRDKILNSFSGVKTKTGVFKFGVKLKGGLGDILIGLNYLNYIVKTLPKENLAVDIYAHRNLQLVVSLLPKDNFINSVQLDDAISDNGNEKYDLFVVLNRYPDVRKKNMDRIQSFCPDLVDFVHACEKWRLENIRVFNCLPVCDGESNYISEILNKKRIQQPDVYNLFSVKESFSYELNIEETSIKWFNQLGLGQFITIHRGNDNRQTKNSVKLWPFDFYNTLIKLIKREYLHIKVVQLGINSERCPEFDNVDLNLVGKTSIEDVKILLKNSRLHIDGEGGFVHLRHALNGGKSVVIFGPTSPAFYGYAENTNLRGEGCVAPCEWIINNWQASCCRGYSRLPCMNSLTPEFVFKNIKNVMEK